jgi:hypothetical protein
LVRATAKKITAMKATMSASDRTMFAADPRA